METPLLALTRSRRGASDGATRDRAAEQNLRQLLQLRWIAVAGQAATILIIHFGLGVPLPLWAMLAVVAGLAAVNLLTAYLLPRHRVRMLEIAVALLIDMAALTLQLYLSGGASNPFVALLLLQVVLGAILLPAAVSLVLLCTAALSYALLTVIFIPLAVPPGLLVERDHLFLVGHWVAFVMVATLLLLFITRISRNLRARDAHLADLRQHAAEEEGIVRMGLFASGAAHELGTPLATVSVILADWRSLPAIARDPELSSELRDMQAELQRCKNIVSDILLSAGQPRGEAMAGAPAADLIDAIAHDWQAAHPLADLDYRRDGLDDTVIAVEPALRQALSSLLDNAAQAIATVSANDRPALSLSATDRQGSLMIEVGDRGPGFPADILDNIGRPYTSTKGAGHGVGLFLAANVARRLGGRLEAENRPEGGALVRLILPIVRP